MCRLLHDSISPTVSHRGRQLERIESTTHKVLIPCEWHFIGTDQEERYDFIECENALHVINASRPGATASLAIGQYIAENVCRLASLN